AFFINAPSSTNIYTLSLHDALPIYKIRLSYYVIVEDTAFLSKANQLSFRMNNLYNRFTKDDEWPLETTKINFLDNEIIFHSIFRSEEHTSELQSRENLVCRLLLEKK